MVSQLGCEEERENSNLWQVHSLKKCCCDNNSHTFIIDCKTKNVLLSITKTIAPLFILLLDILLSLLDSSELPVPYFNKI
jgi:hypothetical protein